MQKRTVYLLKAGIPRKIAGQAGFYLLNGRWHKTPAGKAAPKGAPVASHPEAAGAHAPAKHLTDEQWAKLKLPDTNSNAKTYNAQLDKLKAQSEAGHVTGILGGGYGTNTYGKKLSAIANHLLGEHGSQHTVTPGQKPGSHPAVNGGSAQPEPEAKVSPKPVAAPKPAAATPAMPTFKEGKTTKGVVDYYTKQAEKIMAMAGDAHALAQMKANGLKPNAKGKISNTWAGKTDNSKALLGLHASLVASASASHATPGQDAPKAAEKPAPAPKAAPKAEKPAAPKAEPKAQAPAPKAAPVKASASLSEKQAANMAKIPWEGLKLPDSNTNAKSFNKKIEQLKSAAMAGDVHGILAMQFGTNTYGKKAALLANGVLSGLESEHGVEPGQKANTHPALTASNDVPKAETAPKAEPKAEPKVEKKAEPKPEAKPEPKAEEKPAPKTEAKPKAKAKAKPTKPVQKTPELQAIMDAPNATLAGTMSINYAKQDGKKPSDYAKLAQALQDGGYEAMAQKASAFAAKHGSKIKLKTDGWQGPKEGDTKQGVSGTLVLKNGHWIKTGEEDFPTTADPDAVKQLTSMIEASPSLDTMAAIANDYIEDHPNKKQANIEVSEAMSAAGKLVYAHKYKNKAADIAPPLKLASTKDAAPGDLFSTSGDLLDHLPPGSVFDVMTQDGKDVQRRVKVAEGGKLYFAFANDKSKWQKNPLEPQHANAIIDGSWGSGALDPGTSVYKLVSKPEVKEAPKAEAAPEKSALGKKVEMAGSASAAMAVVKTHLEGTDHTDADYDHVEAALKDNGYDALAKLVKKMQANANAVAKGDEQDASEPTYPTAAKASSGDVFTSTEQGILDLPGGTEFTMLTGGIGGGGISLKMDPDTLELHGKNGDGDWMPTPIGDMTLDHISDHSAEGGLYQMHVKGTGEKGYTNGVSPKGDDIEGDEDHPQTYAGVSVNGIFKATGNEIKALPGGTVFTMLVNGVGEPGAKLKIDPKTHGIVAQDANGNWSSTPISAASLAYVSAKADDGTLFMMHAKGTGDAAPVTAGTDSDPHTTPDSAKPGEVFSTIVQGVGGIKGGTKFAMLWEDKVGGNKTYYGVHPDTLEIHPLESANGDLGPEPLYSGANMVVATHANKGGLFQMIEPGTGKDGAYSKPTADSGPKEGDTKQGVDGMLVLKNGHWVKVGGDDVQLTAKGHIIAGLALGELKDYPAMPSHKLEAMHALIKKEVLEKGAKGLTGVVSKSAANGKAKIKIAGVTFSMNYPPVPGTNAAAMLDAVDNLKSAAKGYKPGGLSAESAAHHASKGLSEEAKEDFDKKVVKLSPSMANVAKAKESIVMPPPVGKPYIPPHLDNSVTPVDDWVQTGPQGGSNPGGKYKDENGESWYVKFPKDEDHAKAEVLAAKLYGLAGVKGQNAKFISKDGKLGIASKWADVSKASPSDLAEHPDVLSGFATDAWLGNWDVVGLGYDNLQVDSNGKAHRIDAGGSLMFRAQGKPKPFGDEVVEMKTLVSKASNPQSAAVFGGMSEADINASVAKVLKVSDAKIASLVNTFGPGSESDKADLIKTLIARKADLAKKYPKAAKASTKKEIKFDPSKLSAPPSFDNWNGPGMSGPSGKQYLNDANEKAVQSIYAAAKTGSIDAVKNLSADTFNKETGEVSGEAPVLEHPSQHVKGYAQQAINEIHQQLNPPKTFRIDGDNPLAELHSSYPVHSGAVQGSGVELAGKFLILGHPGTIDPETLGLPKITYNAGGVTASTYAAQAQALIAQMPETQKQAVAAYTGSSYQKMNASLWAGNPSGLAKSAGEALHALSHEIAVGTVLSRKLTVTGAGAKAILASTGKVLQENAIMSTSIRPSSWSGNIHLKLTVGPGVKGLWVGKKSMPGGGALSNHPGEDEMVLPPGTRLLVTRVKKSGDDPDGFGDGPSHIVEAVILPTEKANN